MLPYVFLELNYILRSVAKHIQCNLFAGFDSDLLFADNDKEHKQQPGDDTLTQFCVLQYRADMSPQGGLLLDVSNSEHTV
ncbi:hypothetical protein BPLS_P0710 [Bathymodiolus platifrons methanotrophic gill symbiont]|nr:hypothetical protein BMR02_09995 [Methylococcaceae bacterium HT1]TXK97619.1 hypothetical protein BMR02_10005 [Methylococcaceae bacterium HT1]TXL16568.1 hypothetical protein BMR04_09330 [Methylococcaceae bacterium HT3]TXL21637.1 hypothetical protein BMR03_12885 [Methylococcaceae bacterium HT2]GFO74180.1 hypothetical protein BPLS_P0710 [Bathymodiolus platifrons methanotrophic gill symbiont]